MTGRSIHAVRARQNPVAWLYRWLLGRPLNGAARTNASFLHPATKNESGYFWTHSWHRCAQWRVAIVHWGIVLWVILGTLFTNTLISFLGVGFMCALPFIVYWSPRLYDIRHYRNIVSPMARAIGPILGIDKTPAANYIDINRRFVHRDNGASAFISIPHSLAGQPGQCKQIELAALHIMAANPHELLFKWAFARPKARLYLQWAPAPPGMVTFGMCREKILALPESSVYIGMARASDDVILDVDNESPHVMISMGTGAGKSALSRSIAAQFLRNGAKVYILDVKRISHPWAKSVPGVSYARGIDEIHEMAIEIGEELDRRNVVADKGNDPGPRIIVVVEEMNMLTRRLKDYWDDIKVKGQPKRSPAISAINDLLFAGRQLKMHGVLIGQYLTAATVGGTEARENLGYRLMGRYSPQSWKNLAGDIPMPPPSRHKGRIQVVAESISTECQTMFMTDEEAISWALYGSRIQSLSTTKTSGPKESNPIPFQNVQEMPVIEGLASVLKRMNTETSSDQ